ncbi:TPA: hypothetical protein KD881_004666, partial [Vibrio parahaemolyticus]|nr:hypothetical protein [Vibrio parahaemolyticus]
AGGENGYSPNKIALSERLACALLSVFLIAYGGYGIYKNDLYIPARRGGVHFSNEPAWLMYGAFVCGCIVMISVIVDHYDERNNERGYRIFRNVFKYLGFGLFCIAALWNLENLIK